MKLVKNAAGRLVPNEVNGVPQTPFKGVGKYRPSGNQSAPPIRSCADYPPGGDKRVGSLKESLQQAGLRDGMTISSHHISATATC